MTSNHPGRNDQTDVTSSYPNAGGAGFTPPLGRRRAARTFLLVLLAIVVSVTASVIATLLPIPHASAAEARKPSAPYPLATTTIVIDAPAGAWGLRAIAADYDRRLPSVDLVFGHCRTDLACVDVTVKRFGKRFDCGDGRLGYYMGCVLTIDNMHRELNLNTSYEQTRRMARAITCHELGHALGLEHHDGRGCLAEPDATSPSRGEVRVLERAYRPLA